MSYTYWEMPWSIENTIENLKNMCTHLTLLALDTNYKGNGKQDAEEIEYDFNRAISALEEKLELEEKTDADKCYCINECEMRKGDKCTMYSPCPHQKDTKRFITARSNLHKHGKTLTHEDAEAIVEALNYQINHL